MPIPRSITHLGGLVACLAVVGCAQKPAHAAPADKDAQMSQTTQSGGKTAADAVAAQLDRIAAESTASSGAASETSHTQKPAPLAGPTLAVSDWIARTLQLIDSLKKPEDTKPAHLARILGLQLTEQDTSYRATGSLAGGGRYSVWSNALYREYPDKWTLGLSQQAAEGATVCLFPLDTLRAHVLQRGFKATEGVVRRDGSEHALFRSPASPEGVTFVVEAVIQRTAGEASCIREMQIDASTRDEEA